MIKKYIDKKKAQAAQTKRELDDLRLMMDFAPQEELEQHYKRAKQLTEELRSVNADLEMLEKEYNDYDPDGRTAAVNGEIPGIVVTNGSESRDAIPDTVLASGGIRPGARPTGNYRRIQPDKVIFRSGEPMAEKYNTTGLDADAVLRAAITGDTTGLSDAEIRTLTPSTGGAMLSPEISSLVIDNLRQSDWISLIQPTFVSMSTAEMKIPHIKGLPTAVMHIPGEEETPTDPTVTAATLSSKTLMVLCEVANELLQDSATSRGVILQACVDAISNKLLQQVLYGTGKDGEMKGITGYEAADFAAAGDKSAVKDIYSLATNAKTAVLKNNGRINAMLYDPDLEGRLNTRLATGELIQPSRAFTELYDAGKVLAHPSISAGDMIFMQADALFIGMRHNLEVQIDPYSSFNSNNTKFRLIIRADCFANAARMAYFDSITEEEPTENNG